MEIRVDDLTGLKVIHLLEEHLESMALLSPEESCHALDLEQLKKPDITFWSVWEGDELAGCGALKQFDSQHAELKSMRTSSSFLRKGVAKRLLEHILIEAKQRGYRRLSLETGSTDDFKPAQKLYASFGFESCEPFADYMEDPYSLFMTKEL